MDINAWVMIIMGVGGLFMMFNLFSIFTGRLGGINWIKIASTMIALGIGLMIITQVLSSLEEGVLSFGDFVTTSNYTTAANIGGPSTPGIYSCKQEANKYNVKYKTEDKKCYFYLHKQWIESNKAIRDNLVSGQKDPWTYE